LNRMTSLINSSGTTNYSYRADGMRVYKCGAFGSSTSFYDGQMPFETTDVATSGTTVTDNAIGSRGIDAMIVTTSSGAATSFPLYDAHGNMVATLARSGSTFITGNQRSFDAWGGIRGGPQSGAPKGRYCAQLGHVQDDESGLIYMRARYYEPGTGRFMNQDPGRADGNWFVYADDQPSCECDPSGRDAIAALILNFLGNALVGSGILMLEGFEASWGGAFEQVCDKAADSLTKNILGAELAASIGPLLNLVKDCCEICSQACEGGGGIAQAAMEKVVGYELLLEGQLLLTDSEFQGGGGSWWGYKANDPKEDF